jgi:ATP-dependent helicase/nuclease subunit B
LLRDIISSGEAVTPEVPVFTLELFALCMWKVIYPGKRAVGEPILTLLLDQAVNSARDVLRYFDFRGARTHLPRGTFERVVHVIRKLKETGVYPERLLEEIRQCESGEELKLADILTIYNGYEGALAKLEGVDPEGVFKMLSVNCTQDEFSCAFSALFPFATEVSINGFDEFTEPELDFISKLCFIDIDVTVVFDFQPGNIPLFGHLEENYKRFLELGFSVQGDTMPGQTGRSIEQMDLFSSPVTSVENNHQWIASNLFKHSFSPSGRKQSPAITIAKAKDRRMEVELICKTIKQLIADNPSIDPSRICVATYKPQTYTAIVREEFSKFGIPVNVTDRYELSESQVVVSIIAVLELITGGFRRDDLLRVLSSSYLVFAHEGTSLDRENLSRVSLQLRLTAGIRHWKNKIEQQIQAQSLNQEDANAGMAVKRNTVRLNDLVRANDDLEYLESLLRNISMEQSPSAFEQNLLALLNKLDVVDRILSPGIASHGDIVEKDSHAYDKFLSVVHQTIALLEYQRGKEARHSLKFYLEQLKVAITEERYNVREQFGRGVLVTSIDETRGLPFDVMIVAGLVDGEFPSVYQSEIFFSSKRLKEREQHHIWENRYLFYQAVTNWSNHLYLTYPEQDADLDLVRSSFVDALENICEVERWEYPGNSPFEDTIYSRRDFLTHYGTSLNLGGSAYLNVPEHLKEHV